MSYASSEAEHLLPRFGFYVTEADFEDVITTWGRYNTPELVKASPFYTKTEIHTDPYARHVLPAKADILTRTVHAVHPIPRRCLREMGPNCLNELGEKLEEERWDVVRDPEFLERLKETLNRIDDEFEFIFRVRFPGSRMFSGRM